MNKKNLIILQLLILSTPTIHHSHDSAYYEILKIKISASEDEIKAAYETLQKKHSHNYRINRAYEVLSSRIKKSIYDTDGLDEVERYEHAVQNNYVDRRYNKVAAKIVRV